MPVSQSTLKADPGRTNTGHSHAHPEETCPTCEQVVPNDRIEQMRARIASRDAERDAAIASRLMEQHQQDKATALEQAKRQHSEQLAKARDEARIAAEEAVAGRVREATEAKAAAEQRGSELQEQIEQMRTESAATLQRLSQESIAREAAIREEVATAAEQAFKQKVADAEQKARDVEAQAELMRAEFNTQLASRLGEQKEALEKAKIEAEQAKAAAEARAAAAEQQARVATESFEAQAQERLEEQRQILEQSHTQAILAEKAASGAKELKLLEKLADLQRTIDKKTAEELGESAEVDLVDALKAEFDSDRITRVEKGEQGADVIHEVMHNGKKCGTIVYDSKNRNSWLTQYVTKLKADQLAAKADHAILSTRKFPAGSHHIDMLDGVILVLPSRVVQIAQIVRQHILLVHTLKLSGEARGQKTAALYDFITSQRCADLLRRIDDHAESLLELQEKEMRAHKAHWKKEGEELRAIQKVRAELVNDIEMIIGTAEAEE